MGQFGPSRWGQCKPTHSSSAFTALPLSFLAALAAMILVTLSLIERGKRRFYHVGVPNNTSRRPPQAARDRRIHHRAVRWSLAQSVSQSNSRRGHWLRISRMLLHISSSCSQADG